LHVQFPKRARLVAGPKGAEQVMAVTLLGGFDRFSTVRKRFL
jgi:hypothetical protein